MFVNVVAHAISSCTKGLSSAGSVRDVRHTGVPAPEVKGWPRLRHQVADEGTGGVCSGGYIQSLLREDV